jgi:hypothetical protein
MGPRACSVNGMGGEEHSRRGQTEHKGETNEAQQCDSGIEG